MLTCYPYNTKQKEEICNFVLTVTPISHPYGRALGAFVLGAMGNDTVRYRECTVSCSTYIITSHSRSETVFERGRETGISLTGFSVTNVTSLRWRSVSYWILRFLAQHCWLKIVFCIPRPWDHHLHRSFSNFRWWYLVTHHRFMNNCTGSSDRPAIDHFIHYSKGAIDLTARRYDYQDRVKITQDDTATHRNPDSKVHVTHMGPTWVLLALGGPHVGPMKIAIRERFPRYWPFMSGGHRIAGGSPHRWFFMFYVLSAYQSCWTKQSSWWGLRCHEVQVTSL